MIINLYTEIKLVFSSPYGDWLYKKSYWGKYWDLIDYNILEEYFDIDKIKSFMSLKINEKWTGNNLNFLMCLLNFQIWHSIYIEQNHKTNLNLDENFGLNY